MAIDCEMGVAFDGESELIRVTVVDYFTGVPLLDSLVWPKVQMQHMNTRYSGVSKTQMETARKRGQCITGGKEEALRAVMRFVGPQTIVVGHAVNNDLNALQWIHHRIIDSYLIESSIQRREVDEWEARYTEWEDAQDPTDEDYADEDDDEGGAPLASESSEGGDSNSRTGGLSNEPEHPGPQPQLVLSLAGLVELRLDRKIRAGRNVGHDSLEDALAARDIVHWHVERRIQENREAAANWAKQADMKKEVAELTAAMGGEWGT